MSQLTSSNSSSPTPPVGVGCAVIGTSIITVAQSGAPVLFNPIYGSNSNQASAYEDTAWVVPVDMTVDRLYVNALYNTMDVDSDIFLIRNGVATALSVTLPAGYTGNVSNVATSVSLSAGDLIVYSHTAIGSGDAFGSISMRMCTVSGDTPALEFVTDDGTVTPNGSGQVFVDGINGVFTEGTSDPNTITISIPNGIASMIGSITWNLGGPDALYLPLYDGTAEPLVNEPSLLMPLPFDGQLDNLTIYCSSNSSVSNTILTVRINQADTALTATIPAGNTGVFTNIVNTVSITKNDLISFKFENTDGDNSLNFSFSMRYIAT